MSRLHQSAVGVNDQETGTVGVVGAGLAGLECARRLRRAGARVVVWDAADAVGGRIRTDEVDGFLLDRGFQLLNPAYPAVRRDVDVAALDLGGFAAGVAARTEAGLLRLGHPLREPTLLPATLRALAAHPSQVLALARWAAPLASTLGRTDKAGRLRRRVDRPLARSLDDVGLGGVVRRVVDRFFAGVLLEDDGDTSTQFALLLTYMFLTGVPGLPSRGMRALPEQLAEGLDDDLRLSAPVRALEPSGDGFLVHDDGGSTRVDHVVVATDAVRAEALLDLAVPRTRGVVTQYFAADEVGGSPRLLHVDARRGPGPLVNAAVVSAAQPAYAPSGRHLVQASALLGPDRSAPGEREMRDQAGLLLGCSTSTWSPLGRYEIHHALPARPAPFTPGRPRVTETGVVVCGDHCETPSIQGAMVSGRDAARAVLDGVRHR